MKQQIKELSVLIPTYNHVCYSLVCQLLPLLQKAAIRHEIIVADDGSDKTEYIRANRRISELPCCRHIIRSQNKGRAAIRNLLAREASYTYLLYIDSDMTVISDSFIARYLTCQTATVIDGGVSIGGDSKKLKGNLRYLYEKKEEGSHTVEERQKKPYQHLHTANLLIRRDIMLQHPFDERFTQYGYEDVLLGKILRQHNITIIHIDNPLGFCTFENNEDFMEKTEEGLQTLHKFQGDLRGYSRLLTFVNNIHLPVILSLFRLWHRIFKTIERQNLCSRHPSLIVFKIYRLGYFLSL